MKAPACSPERKLLWSWVEGRDSPSSVRGANPRSGFQGAGTPFGPGCMGREIPCSGGSTGGHEGSPWSGDATGAKHPLPSGRTVSPSMACMNRYFHNSALLGKLRARRRIRRSRKPAAYLRADWPDQTRRLSQIPIAAFGGTEVAKCPFPFLADFVSLLIRRQIPELEHIVS